MLTNTPETMRKTNFTALILFVILAIAIPRFAEAKTGWNDVDDGYTYSDERGCMHHVHTQEWRLLGITWKTRTVDVIVDCDNNGPDPVNN